MSTCLWTVSVVLEKIQAVKINHLSRENKKSLLNKTLEFPTYDLSGRYTRKTPSRSTPDLIYTSSPDTPNPNTESTSDEEIRGVTRRARVSFS